MLINESAEQYLKRVAPEVFYAILEQELQKISEQKSGIYESNPQINTPSWITSWKQQQIISEAKRFGFGNSLNS